MGGAWTGGERLDVVTVGRHCPHVPAELLAGLLADTPSVSNAMRYASQVVDLAARRRLIHAASEMIQAAQQTDAEEALGRARDALAGISLAAGKPTPDPDVDSFIGSVDTTHDWLVPGWLERGDRLLVTASEGAGKSTFLAQIATQVSAGIHPWSFGRMKPRNVTYIDLENGDRLVSRRLQDQRHYVPEDYDPQRFRVQVKPEGLNLLKRADRRWLMQRCLANQAELLVIGPAYRMMSGSASKNDAGGEDQTREVTAALDEVRTQCGLVLLIETHAPHGNSVTGTRPAPVRVDGVAALARVRHRATPRVAAGPQHVRDRHVAQPTRPTRLADAPREAPQCVAVDANHARLIPRPPGRMNPPSTGEPVTEIRLDAFRFRRNASRPDRWESVDETLDDWASEHAAALNAALDEIERLRNALYWAALDYDDPADQVDYWIRKGNR
jgi:hypothetical protein